VPVPGERLRVGRGDGGTLTVVVTRPARWCRKSLATATSIVRWRLATTGVPGVALTLRLAFTVQPDGELCALRSCASTRLCVACEGLGHLVASVVADHINPIKDGGERFDWANLQGLCISCPNRKTAGETARARVPNLLAGGLRVKANA
jgi:5-methylcytosine-specific restriction endonuclease McrA